MKYRRSKATPNANEVMKLLDNGWKVRLEVNVLGSYTARATHSTEKIVVTDDFTPAKALHRLAEKVHGNIVEWEKGANQT